MTAYRVDPAALADVQMALMLHDASPDGQAEIRGALDRMNLVPGTVTVQGHWCSPDNPECESHD